MIKLYSAVWVKFRTVPEIYNVNDPERSDKSREIDPLEFKAAILEGYVFSLLLKRPMTTSEHNSFMVEKPIPESLKRFWTSEAEITTFSPTF